MLSDAAFGGIGTFNVTGARSRHYRAMLCVHSSALLRSATVTTGPLLLSLPGCITALAAIRDEPSSGRESSLIKRRGSASQQR